MFNVAVGQALTYGMDITKFPKAGVLADRAVLYKHAFSKIRLKNSVIDHDAEQYKEQVLKVRLLFLIRVAKLKNQ